MPVELQPINKILYQYTRNLLTRFRTNLPTEYNPITGIVLPPK